MFDICGRKFEKLGEQKPSWNLMYPLDNDQYIYRADAAEHFKVKELCSELLTSEHCRFGHIFVYRFDGGNVGRLWYLKERIATDHGVCDLGDNDISEVVADIGEGRGDFYIRMKE